MSISVGGVARMRGSTSEEAPSLEKNILLSFCASLISSRLNSISYTCTTYYILDTPLFKEV